MSHYQPPLSITPKILNLLAHISEQLGRIAERDHRAQALRLRRAGTCQPLLSRFFKN